MDKTLTTADVPPQFLAAAMLVGHIPRTALKSDPRLSYALYVPPTHYNHNPKANRPEEGGLPLLPLLVTVHGTKRNISPIHKELVPFAEATPCAVLAPLFPAGLDHPLDLDSYKGLRSRTLRSDLALLGMLDEVGHRWPGIDTSRVYLMGFSGGGQFAHRFLYLYPERLVAVSVGAPGSTTLLDPAQKWPVGIADVEGLFGRSVDKELIRRVSIHLVVGGADVGVHGSEEFWEWLMHSGIVPERTQKNVPDGNKAVAAVRNRLGTIQQLKARWEEDGIEAQLDVVPGAAHESAKVLDHVLEFMEALMRRSQSPLSARS